MARTARSAATPAPQIRQWRIPFGADRKRDMRRYARRHYGIDDHRLVDPRVIVLHLSVTDTAQAVFNTFAPNRPDPELGELPGVCTHYVVAKNGFIFQLVSRRLMCRHTVGLNYTSFGIEHVGRSDAGVFARRRQLRASLRAGRVAAGPLRDPHAERDRPQREPHEPVSPGAGEAPAEADARRLPAPVRAALPRGCWTAS